MELLSVVGILYDNTSFNEYTSNIFKYRYLGYFYPNNENSGFGNPAKQSCSLSGRNTNALK